MYPFQTERKQLTITIVITKIIILITTCEPYISDQVSLINGAPLAAHNRKHG
jgi:isochorismate hydrolase